MRNIIAAVFLVCLCYYVVDGYPTGAPERVCDSMQPNLILHGTAQSGSSGYTVSFVSSNGYYGNGDNIEVRISGGQLRGLLCQVRDDDETPMGAFMVPQDSGLQTINCGSGSGNAVTHTNRDDKSGVSFTWSPPETDVGDVTLRCTIVREQRTFWIGLESSQSLTFNTGTPSPAPEPTTPTPRTANMATDGMGTTTAVMAPNETSTIRPVSTTPRDDAPGSFTDILIEVAVQLWNWFLSLFN